MQVAVRIRGGRPVRPLDDDLRLDGRGVLDRDLVFERGRDQDVDIELEEILVGQRFAAWETGDGLVLTDVFEERCSGVQTVRFEPDEEGSLVELELDYELTKGGPLRGKATSRDPRLAPLD